MRRREFRDVGWIAALATVLIVGGFWALLRQRPHSVPPAKPMPTLPEDIQVRLGKVRLQGVTGGKLVWEIEAASFDFAKFRPVLTVTGLKKAVILNGDKAELTLTAHMLERNTASGRITVSGNVCVQGAALQINAAMASWDPFREALQFSSQLSVRLGDFSITCMGPTQLDINAGQLTSSGGVVLTTQDSTLHAESIRLNVKDKSYELDGPVTAQLSVADMESWAAGHHLPTIPPIPESIKARYGEYMQKKAHAAFPGILPSPRKGAR